MREHCLLANPSISVQNGVVFKHAIKGLESTKYTRQFASHRVQMSLQNRCHRQKKSHTDAIERKCKNAPKGDKQREGNPADCLCVHFHTDSLARALEATMAVLISNCLPHWFILKRPRDVSPKNLI